MVRLIILCISCSILVQRFRQLTLCMCISNQWFRVLCISSSHPSSGSEYVYFTSEVHTHPVVQSTYTSHLKFALILWFRAGLLCQDPHSSNGSEPVYLVYVTFHTHPMVQSPYTLYTSRSTLIQWFRARIFCISSSSTASGSEQVYFVYQVHQQPVVQSRCICISSSSTASGSEQVYFVYQVPHSASGLFYTHPLVQNTYTLYIKCYIHHDPVVQNT